MLEPGEDIWCKVEVLDYLLYIRNAPYGIAGGIFYKALITSDIYFTLSRS